jgi:hypothetical protein
VFPKINMATKRRVVKPRDSATGALWGRALGATDAQFRSLNARLSVQPFASARARQVIPTARQAIVIDYVWTIRGPIPGNRARSDCDSAIVEAHARISVFITREASLAFDG